MLMVKQRNVLAEIQMNLTFFKAAISIDNELFLSLKMVSMSHHT